MPSARGSTALPAAVQAAPARAVILRCAKGRTGELTVDAAPMGTVMSSQDSDGLSLRAQIRIGGLTGGARGNDHAGGVVSLVLRPGPAVDGFDNGAAVATAPATIEVPVRAAGHGEGPVVLTGSWTLSGSSWKGVPGDYNVLVKGVTLAIPGVGKCRVAAGAESPVATFFLRTPVAGGPFISGPSARPFSGPSPAGSPGASPDASAGPVAGPFPGPASGDGRGVGIGWLTAILLLIIAVVAVWRVTSARRPPDPVTGRDDGAGVGPPP